MRDALSAQVPNERLRFTGATATGLVAGLAFFAAFGGWATFVPLSSAVLAAGVVQVEDDRKVVQHLEGGIVADLAVREGDRVKAGDILISLDTTQARARHALLEGRIVNRLALAARLRAERDGTEAIEFPAELSVLPSLAARNAARVQKEVFEARRSAVSAQAAILTKRIEQTKEEIAGLEQLVTAQDRLIATLEEEASDLDGLLGKGLTTRERYMALRHRQAELEGERAVHVASIARARKSISELEQQILELSVTRLNQAVGELSEVEGDLLDLQEQIRSATDILARADIRAPVAGTVINLGVHSVHGVVKPGEPLMEIVPAAADVLVEAHIRPENIDEVSAGQSVEVRFRSSEHYRNQLAGSVRRVSPDRLVDERTGESYFTATVELTRKAPTDGSLAIMPGMPADVVIVTGKRTLFEYIAGPLTRRLDHAMREK